MCEITLSNSLEVHESWLMEIRLKLKAHGGIDRFSDTNNINYFSVFWFTKGNPVIEGDFKNICRLLDLDWEKVQNSASERLP